MIQTVQPSVSPRLVDSVFLAAASGDYGVQELESCGSFDSFPTPLRSSGEDSDIQGGNGPKTGLGSDSSTNPPRSPEDDDEKKKQKTGLGEDDC